MVTPQDPQTSCGRLRFELEAFATSVLSQYRKAYQAYPSGAFRLGYLLVKGIIWMWLRIYRYFRPGDGTQVIFIQVLSINQFFGGGLAMFLSMMDVFTFVLV